MKFHVKRGDEVVVISGAHQDKRGKVLQILPAKQRVVVEGVNLIKRHVRKNQENPDGAIIEREGSIHISNVMKADVYDARAQKKTNA